LRRQRMGSGSPPLREPGIGRRAAPALPGAGRGQVPWGRSHAGDAAARDRGERTQAL